jgi:hypothetical protein
MIAPFLHGGRVAAYGELRCKHAATLRMGFVEEKGK